MNHRPHSLLAALFASVVLLSLLGCRSGPRNYENDNDRLRRENTELNEKITSLATQVQSLEKLAKATEKSVVQPLPEGILQPRCAQVTISSFSGGIDTNADQIDDTIRLYIQTLDARDRFVQTVAHLKISLVQIIPGKEVITLAVVDIDPKQFDAGYRSGITGAHYTLQIPLPNAPLGLKEITCRIALTDLQTGLEHQAESLLRWSDR